MSEVSVLCDLRSKVDEARDQGARPTCLAFAASDCHATTRGELAPLSAEYIFYHAQRRGGRSPNVGATVPDTLDALREDGQPIEADWPYLATVPADLALWLPPASVTIYRCGARKGEQTVAEIVSLLDQERCPIVLLTLSDAFYAPDADGVVQQNIGEMPDPNRRHAVIAVGYGQLANERLILVRNSWGTDWGLDGNAWLPESFLSPRLKGVVMLRGGGDVPTH